MILLVQNRYHNGWHGVIQVKRRGIYRLEGGGEGGGGGIVESGVYSRAVFIIPVPLLYLSVSNGPLYNI